MADGDSLSPTDVITAGTVTVLCRADDAAAFTEAGGSPAVTLKA